MLREVWSCMTSEPFDEDNSERNDQSDDDSKWSSDKLKDKNPYIIKVMRIRNRGIRDRNDLLSSEAR